MAPSDPTEPTPPGPRRCQRRRWRAPGGRTRCAITAGHARGIGSLGLSMAFLACSCGRQTVSRPVPPTISIAAPSSGDQYETFFTQVHLSGSVSGATRVRWNNSGNATRGDAVVTGDSNHASWSADIPDLVMGSNPISIIADGGSAERVSTASIRVIYDPYLDHEPPTMTISTPSTSAPVITTITPIDIAGTAADNSGSFTVSWHNVTTGDGEIATGTTSWHSKVPLLAGQNVVFVFAIDAGGNITRDTLDVTLETPGSASRIVTGASGARAR